MSELGTGGGHLKKSLNLIDVFSISSGAMISSGIFVLPGAAFALAGPGVFVSYMLAGILALIGVFAVIELSTAMPKAGGDYYFIERSMGPLAGTISGFLSWFALSMKSAFAIFGMAELLKILIGLPPGLMEVVITLLFVALNIFGIKKAAKFETVLVLALLGIMSAFIILCMPHVQVTRFEPFVPDGASALTIVATAGMVFVSFGGLLKLSSVSEEVRNPSRNIPLGMILSIVIVTILYTLIMIVIVGISSHEVLNRSMTPLADAASQFYGKPAFYIICAGAAFAFLTTANAGIMSASRYPLALSRDQLIPEWVSRVNPKFNTPVWSLIITGIFIILALQLELMQLVKAASAIILSSYILSNTAIIILRESGLRNYRPTFKAPLYPWLQIMSILLFCGMIVMMGWEAVDLSLAVLLLGLVVFMFYGRRANREFALLHLLGRITNKKLTTHGLERELRDIIQRRDDVVKDDFDYLVESAPTLIIEEKIGSDELFKRIAAEFSETAGLDKDTMYTLLQEREAESSTAISQYLAIPHLIVEGEGKFMLFLVKCAGGVEFSEECNDVKAIFVLLGTRDLRNRHLKTLAAIAQVAQNKKFGERWLNVMNQDQLHDVLLLAKRNRH
jgi:basic amino acid/polyamine antiporter, APA family